MNKVIFTLAIILAIVACFHAQNVGNSTAPVVARNSTVVPAPVARNSTVVPVPVARNSTVAPRSSPVTPRVSPVTPRSSPVTPRVSPVTPRVSPVTPRVSPRRSPVTPTPVASRQVGSATTIFSALTAIVAVVALL